jgi:hypothetical protein
VQVAKRHGQLGGCQIVTGQAAWVVATGR